MISINQLNVSFGGFELLRDISFLINPRDRIGLVGKNGAGKSTLMKIISGLQEPSSGEIAKPDDYRIGYLPQTMALAEGRSVYNETKRAFDEVLSIDKEMKEINLELAARDDYHSDAYEKLIHRLTDLNERFQLLGGASIDADIEQTLTGLGFEVYDMQRQTKEFSGGWRMRIELAKLLLRKPNILLLDEPTNHLDIESIQWLENYLVAFDGAALIVSHDRAFLDNVTNRTVEISLGKIYDYKVNYSRYVELRKERREQQMAAYRNQQKLIEETEDFIERFRYKATKAVQVQSRIKQLDRLERLEVDEEDVSTLNLKFAPAPRSGNMVVEALDVSKAYGSKKILENVDFTIERSEKVAFVGRNGEGKTTFSKMIVGETDFTGNLKVGHNVKIGYFAQNQDELMDENITVFDTIDRVAVGDIRTKIRDLLGAFLFRGEDVEKKVKVLSGGERSRLAMVKLLLEPYNLLVMDEPTNHLDMRSKDILKQAILKYDGTVIVVSHDREFLDGLVTKVYEFRNKKIKQHL
ncbi:MAG TPA: ABC-F family ATP-binding cassette domain-containing protein, partial [Bacteroidales bacterium]|nr:ABC-F family ATP-binding cassette domain-containing protein [Bacteroidales bacterium]